MIEDIRDDEAFDHIDSLARTAKTKQVSKRIAARRKKSRPMNSWDRGRKPAPVTLASHA